jgi:hypothetical protein
MYKAAYKAALYIIAAIQFIRLHEIVAFRRGKMGHFF